MAQEVSFNHLNTANGLSDNLVQCVTTDKKGFLWIGTINGLNLYDGFTVTKFNSMEQAGLCSDNIAGLFCDSRNRVWVGSGKGVTMIDEQRHFHKIILSDSLQTNYDCSVIIETNKFGIILCTDYGHYYIDEKTNKWTLLKWSSDEQYKVGWWDNAHFKKEEYIHTGQDNIIILDYAAEKKVFEFPLQYVISACRLNDDEIIAAVFKGKLVRISISQHKIIKEYPLTGNRDGKTVNTNITNLRQAANGKIIVSTGFAGMYIFDPAGESFSQNIHDPLEPGSITSNIINKVYCDSAGNVFLSMPNKGLDYFNINRYKISWKAGFLSGSHQLYDQYINYIKQDNKGIFWMGTHDGLMRWDKKINDSYTYPYYYPILEIGERPLVINCINFDKLGRIWVGTAGGGLGLFNEHSCTFTRFSNDTLNNKPPGFPDTFVLDMLGMPDGNLWVCTHKGMISFNTINFSYDALSHQPYLKQLPEKSFYRIFSDSKNNIWMASVSSGVYCYKTREKKLRNFSENNGLSANLANAFAEDGAGNVYIATSNGMSVINNGEQITRYNTSNGLRYNDCESLLRDSSGNIWIANHNCLIKFNQTAKSFQYFDQRDGIGDVGFKANAAWCSSNGSFYFGTERGTLFFSPDKLKQNDSPISLFVNEAVMEDSIVRFTGSSTIYPGYNKSAVTFFFGSVDLYSEKNITYQYQLDGSDKDWVNNAEQRKVRFNFLSPGKYNFKVRASRDGINWTSSGNTIALIIHPAFWQTGWFKLLHVLIAAGLVYYLIWQRIHKIKEREKLQRQYEKRIAEVEMSSLRAQMNPHFMFNSLNSINNFILKNDPENASGYLTKFSRLMRLILDNSRSEWVVLEDELKALELYIELEALRFDNTFEHRIEITQDVDVKEVIVPPMIIQPYVENAIWHGLIHRKEPGGKLDIQIWRNNGMLNIEIEDNGIGREEAKRRKSKSATRQKSHGMQITAQRLDIVNQLYGVNAAVTITDLQGPGGKAAGTIVLLNLQYKTDDSDHS